MTRIEAIIEARRRINAGDFRQAIVKTEPENIHFDRATLACGHTMVWSPTLPLDRMDALVYCNACAEEWIVENSK